MMAFFSRVAVLLLLVCTSDGKTAPLDSESAASLLNDHFSGRGNVSGVFMRQMRQWELFCGGGCYKGRPGCIMSAEFYNYKTGIYKSQFVGEFMFAPYAGVIFHSDLVVKNLAKCYFDTDGMTYNRYNGGCGCSASEADVTCDSPHSPYANIGPDGKFVSGDTPYAKSCMCNSTRDQAAKEDGQPCFWPGPAYSTGKGPFGKSELSKMVEQYQVHNTQQREVQWDEVVLDAGALRQVLETDPAAAIVAVYYDAPSYHWRGGDHWWDPAVLKIALGIQQSLLSQYGVRFPIVGSNGKAVLTPGKGPFVAHPVWPHSGSVSVVI